MVQFEKRFVSGHRFSDATKATSVNGFSRRGLPVAAQRLKPGTLLFLAACLKACPDTNLFSNCTTTEILAVVPRGGRSAILMGYVRDQKHWRYRPGNEHHPQGDVPAHHRRELSGWARAAQGGEVSGPFSRHACAAARRKWPGEVRGLFSVRGGLP